MTAEEIHVLIDGLYDAKDNSSDETKEYVQQTIDLLDELLMAGSIYLDEE